MGSTLYFYVVNLRKDDTPLMHAYLNTLRLLASPDTRHEAHVTVRGPKKGQLNDTQLRGYNEKLNGKSMQIDGPACFFNSHQHTVYLSCDSDPVADVWQKKDYGDGKNAHLTLYDGDSRKFAGDLLRRLNGPSTPCFEIENIRLELLESSKTRQPSAFDRLYEKIDTDHFQAITRRRWHPESVYRRCSQDRLRVIEEIWEHLIHLYKKVGRCLTEQDLALPTPVSAAAEYGPYAEATEDVDAL